MLEKYISPKHQLDLISALLVALLAFNAWQLADDLTVLSVLPLIAILYAIGRVIYELTFNRNNVPTLAMSLKGRALMARELAAHSVETAAARDYNPFTIVDYGSGRGELTRHLARRVPNSKVIGLEISTIPFHQAEFMRKWGKWDNLSYERQDFFTFDCSKTDAVVMYLSGNMTLKVGEKLYNSLPKGACVLTHTFPLGAPWQAAKEILYRTPFKEKIYLYIKN